MSGVLTPDEIKALADATRVQRGGEVVLRLYVAGQSPNSLLAQQNLRAALAQSAPDAKVEIVDVLLDPSRADDDGIIVTPTLVRVAPTPQRRLVGNLKDWDMLQAVLELPPEAP